MNGVVEISAAVEKDGGNRARSQSAPALLSRHKSPPQVKRYCAAIQYANLLKEAAEDQRTQRLVAEAKIKKTFRNPS